MVLITENYNQDLSEWFTFIADQKLADIIFFQAIVNRCKHYLGNQQVQALIHSKDSHFDLIILEYQDYECFLGFAHHFDAPIVGVYAQGGPHWIADILGNTSPASYVPNTHLFYTDRMTFTQRMQNAISINARQRTFRERLCFKFFIEKYFKLARPIPSVEELENRTSMLLFNNDLSFNVPRPYLPNTQDIAGMHIKAARPLSTDLQTLLDQASQGVILFSMGSVFGSFKLAKSKYEAFLGAFSTLSQLVLWKRDTILPDLPDNVRLVKWLPQSDVLAHPNVRVLLSHGGMLSTQEAIYHAVPLVGIPINGDQFANAGRAQHLGFGIRLDYDNLTTESLEWALKAVIYEPRYLENARLASSRFRDQIVPPLEKAVFWTEYVLRHKGAGHLRCAALDLAWYEYWLLDVVGVLALGGSMFMVVSYAAARALCSLLRY